MRTRRADQITIAIGTTLVVASLALAIVGTLVKRELRDSDTSPRDSSITRLADAARQARSTVIAYQSVTPRGRPTAIDVATLAIERVGLVGDDVADVDTHTMIGDLKEKGPRDPATPALLDRIIARADRLATSEAIADYDARRQDKSDVLERTLLTSELLALSGVLVVFLGFRSLRKAAERVDAIVTDSVPGKTAPDRVAYLVGRERRARQTLDSERQRRDVLIDQLDAAGLANREKDRLIERHATEIKRLRIATLQDEMTGLWKKSYLLATLRHAINRYLDSGVEFVVLAGDLDNFKQINDTQGHRAGDAAIRDVARILATLARSDDVVARTGGDEFVLLLQATSGADGFAMATRMAGALKQHTVRAPKGDSIVEFTVGGSIGCLPASCLEADYLREHVDEEVDNTDNLALGMVLGLADRAAAAAKKAGKGTAVLYTSDLDVADDEPTPPAWADVRRYLPGAYAGLDSADLERFMKNYDEIRAIIGLAERS